VTERLVAAFVGLAVLIPAIVWGGFWVSVIIVAIAAGICLTEYVSMAFPEDRGPAFAFLAPWTMALFAGMGFAPERLGVGLALAGIATLAFVTFRPGPELSRAADLAARHLLGMVWIGVLLGTLVVVRKDDQGLAWIFFILGISWLADTGGYFGGRFFGKTPLYPRISPKKTVEGLVGGLITSVVGSVVIARIGLVEVPVWHVVILGFFGCLLSVVGDLSESMLKRAWNVKDSGWIMPGHGGLLDRIDSVLFVAPWVCAYVSWVDGTAG
jgi:phosphatidate cytidylyltransferase